MLFFIERHIETKRIDGIFTIPQVELIIGDSIYKYIEDYNNNVTVKHYELFVKDINCDKSHILAYQLLKQL